MVQCGSQMKLRGWREALIFVFISSTICFAKNNVTGGGEILDILSSVKGSYTQMLDDDLSLTVSYDLADDSRVPISFVTGIGVTKGHDFFRKRDPTEAIARLTLSGSMMTKGRIPSGGFVLEANDRSLGVNVNHAIRRVQFRFGRTLLDGRVRVGLNPLVTYGALRRSSVDFGQWVPSYRPLLSEAGVPRMSLQQRDVEWDWSQGMPSRSPLHGLGVSLRLHAGRRGWLSATIFNGRERSRLWSLRAEAPLAKPSKVYFNIERAWQVRTTAN